MKKSKVKRAIKTSMQAYYKSGLTNTAMHVYIDIAKEIDKLYSKK